MTHQLTHPEVHIDVNIPRTWKDVSYKNDALPSWEFGDLQIFIGDTTSTVMEDLNYKYTVILKSQYSCAEPIFCLLYTSPSPRDRISSRMPSSA